MAPQRVWDDKKIALLRKHAGTMSANDMVVEFFPTMSRNALIGVAFRHGITFKKRPRRDPDAKRVRKPQPPRRAKEVAPDMTHMRGSSAPTKVRPQVNRTLPPADPPPLNDVRSPRRMLFEEAPEGAWTLWNIGHGQCHFPIGHDGRLTLYCGDVVWREGGTYCRHHIGLMTAGGRSALASS